MAEKTELQLKQILNRIWLETILKRDGDGRTHVCLDWKKFENFATWALEMGWKPGGHFHRHTHRLRWSPENAYISYENYSGMTMPQKGQFLENWERMQEIAAVKWLGMPWGTTPEQFRAALKKTGLLSPPPEVTEDE